MRPPTVLFLLFVVVPLIEIALFVIVGQRIGVGATIGLVVLTAVVGAALVSRQGRGQLARVRATVIAGSSPAAELAHGVMIFIAFAFLITPGFFTDAVALLLLVPPVREALRRRWQRRRNGREGEVEIL